MWMINPISHHAPPHTPMIDAHMAIHSLPLPVTFVICVYLWHLLCREWLYLNPSRSLQRIIINRSQLPDNECAARLLTAQPLIRLDSTKHDCRLCGLKISSNTLVSGRSMPAHVHCVMVSLAKSHPQCASFFQRLMDQTHLPVESRPVDRCAICLSLSLDTCPDAAYIGIDRCTHYFHASCLIQSLSNTFTCPLCRHDPIVTDVEGLD